MYRANKASQALPNKLFILNYLASLALNICKQEKDSVMACQKKEKYSAHGGKKRETIKALRQHPPPPPPPISIHTESWKGLYEKAWIKTEHYGSVTHRKKLAVTAATVKFMMIFIPLTAPC